MRLPTTLVLAAIAILLGIVIHRVDERPVAGQRAADLARVLVRFAPDAADKITIERGPARTTLTRREGGAWFLVEPETDRADANVILALLDRLNHLGIVEELAPGTAPEDQAIGLSGEKAIRVTVSGPPCEGTPAFSESLILGIEAPRSGSLYARREGKDGAVHVVDGNPRPFLESPLETLRDRRLLGAPVGAVVQLVIRQASGEIALQRRITPPLQDWALVVPITSWANREAMDQLLTAIGGLQIGQVLPEAVAAEEIPNPLPADAVVIQAQIHGIEKPLTLFLKKTGEAENGLPLLEARVSDRPAVYQLASNFLETLPQEANELRDRTLARLPLDHLDSIKIQSRVDPLVDLRAERGAAGVNWKVALGAKLMPANQTEVTKLVNAVNEAAIQRFVSDEGGALAEYGLVPPQRSLIFQLKLPGEPRSDGSPGAPRELNRILNLGWKDEGPLHLYANFRGEPHVYELDPSFLELIKTHPLKWKSLQVLNINPMHLVSITREMPEKELLKLTYIYQEDRWEASRNGNDVTQSVDIASARRLRDRLGALTASTWYLSIANAIEALQSPSVQFTIVTRELDRAVNQSKEVTYQMKLAPLSDDLYFGQIAGSPDVFILDRATYGDLIRQVTSSRLPQ